MNKEEAKKEIDRMVEIYRSCGLGHGGFLVGTSLCGGKHPHGDSGRFHELLEIVNNPHAK